MIWPKSPLYWVRQAWLTDNIDRQLCAAEGEGAIPRAVLGTDADRHHRPIPTLVSILADPQPLIIPDPA